MSLTKFPLETKEPTLDVVLPVGVHTLKLTVKDNAGMMSLPDRVVVTVEPVPPPVIHSITCDHAHKGETVDAVIYGKALAGNTSLQVYRNGQLDARVVVRLREEGSNDHLPVTIEVLGHAIAGLYTIAVTTLGGTDTVSFTVLPGHVVAPTRITPAWGYGGRPQPLAVRISGDTLDDVNGVTFFRHDQPDPQIKSVVQMAQPDDVDVAMTISANAEFGPRTFTVTTSTGVFSSPPGVIFTVLPGYLQLAIMLVTLVIAGFHMALAFPNLLYILNGLGYLALLVVLYLPTRWLFTGTRPLMRWVLVCYVLLTLISWVAMGERIALAYVTLVLELLLLTLLFLESRQPQAV